MTTQNGFQWPDGKKAAVSISMDDARPSQVDAGLPVLDRYGVKATFYLSPPNIHLRQDAWRNAAASGHEMGNHTLTHPCSGNFTWSRANALEEKSLDDIALELSRANDILTEMVGVAPRTFAYPCGQKYVGRGRNLLSYVPVAGRQFVACRGFRDETVNAPGFCDLAQVMGVDSDDHPFDMIKAWIERAVAECGWVVFCSHDIGKYPRQAMAVDILEALCEYCVAPENGIWIDTVAAIGLYILEKRQIPSLES